MTIEEVNDYADTCDKQIIVFSNPSYDTAILGISSDDRVIYDYDLMVKYLIDNDNLSEIDAVEFIDYNTIRAMAYEPSSPIILQIKEFCK